MQALQSRPGAGSETLPERVGDTSDAEGVAQRTWKMLVGRLEHRKKVEPLHRRSDEDVAYFELIWKATGRDVYRFSEW